MSCLTLKSVVFSTDVSFLSQKSSDSKYWSHSCWNQNRVVVKSRKVGRNKSAVWCVKVQTQLDVWFPNVCKELLCRRGKLNLTALETGLKSLLSKFKCASFKSPQTTTVNTLYKQTRARRQKCYLVHYSNRKSHLYELLLWDSCAASYVRT